MFNKREKIRKNIIKNEKLDTIEKTIQYITKIVKFMDKEKLEATELYILKKPKFEATDLWLKIIDDRKKELNK